MSNKVIHVSVEAHRKAIEYCHSRGLYMSSWIEYLILKAIDDKDEIFVIKKKKKKITKYNDDKVDSVWTSPPFWEKQ
jgi:hypothetical protein